MKHTPSFLFVLFLGLCATAVLAQSSNPWRPLCEPGCGGWMTSVQVSPHDARRVLVGGDMLGTGLSTDGGESWKPTFGWKSAEIGDFTFHPTDPKMVFAGTMSGVYRSRDGGSTWEECRVGFPPVARYQYSAPVEKVLFDPRNPSRLLAFGGSSRRWGSPGKPLWGTIWESTDLGDSWKPLANLEKNIVSAAFSPDGQTLLACVDGSGVFRSSDGGTTWENSSAGLPHGRVERVVFHAQNSKIFWVSLVACPRNSGEKCLPGGVYMSEDGGKTWASRSNGLDLHMDGNVHFTASFKAFCGCPADPDVLYVSDMAWNGARIYRTSNGGESWEVVLKTNLNGVERPLKTAYPSGYGVTVLSVDPRDPDVVFGAGSEYIALSRDGGKSWQDGTSVKVGDPDQPTWHGRGYSGLCSTNFVMDPFHRGRAVLLAMDAGKCWETCDGGKSWTYRGQKPGPWGGGNDAVFSDDGSVYVTTGQSGSDGNILRGRLGEPGPWTPLNVAGSGLPEAGSGVALGVYALPDDSARVWVVCAKKLYSTTDSGAHWERCALDDELGWIAAARSANPLEFYVSGKSGLWKTTDGRTFENVGGPEAAGRLEVDARGRVLLAAYRGKRVGLWRWDGVAWSCLNSSEFVYDVTTDPRDATRIAVCSKDDPFHDHIVTRATHVSSDDGQTWEDFSGGLPTQRASSILFTSSGRLIIGTGGCGFFYRK